MKKRKRITVYDSDDESDDGAQTPDSTQVVKNSATNKQKATARKRGRPPATSKKKAPTSPDDSDDCPSTQPNTPQNSSSDPSENEDNSSDSDYNAASTSRPKRGSKGPASLTKKQRLQNGSLRDASPQPSTSQNGTIQNVQETESEYDSSSSEDSDCGPVNEKSVVKKKPLAVKPSPVNSRVAKKKVNHSASGNNSSAPSVNSSQLNTSKKQSVRLSQKQDLSMDLKLVENLAQRLVYFLLIEDQKKYAIRRKAIVTHVFKDEYSPKLYAAVIKKANLILKKIYGMELMELENQKDSYLIVNILRRELGIHDYVDLPRIKQQQHGLILFLLTVIYMNENVISEDELTRSLKPLGIDLTSKRMHPVFGDVKKYITSELVRQMYLNYECISKEPLKHEFTWGLRAKQEFDKRDLLQFVCTIMDDISPEDWRIQFRDAEASAKPCANS